MLETLDYKLLYVLAVQTFIRTTDLLRPKWINSEYSMFLRFILQFSLKTKSELLIIVDLNILDQKSSTTPNGKIQWEASSAPSHQAFNASIIVRFLLDSFGGS